MADPVPGEKGARKSVAPAKTPVVKQDAFPVTAAVEAKSAKAAPAAAKPPAPKLTPAPAAVEPKAVPVAAEPAIVPPAPSPTVAEAAPEPVAAPAPTSSAPAIEAAPVLPVPAAPVEVAPEPVLTPANAVSATAERIKKGYQIMATSFDTAAATDKAKAMFGDVSERTKGAMEKSVKLGEEMTEFTKGNVEALVASGRIAAKGAETLAQDVAETVKKHFEGVTAQMKSFASVKSPTELFQLQSEYAKSSFDSAVADASKFSESMMKLFGDIAQPLSSRYAVAAEKIKATSL